MRVTDRKTVYTEVNDRIYKILSGDDASVREKLAKLRHGLGKVPGEDPMIWGMLFDQLPKEMLGKKGEPSKEEWAIYAALTLYALHQQGSDPRTQNVNQKDISLGTAAFKLVRKEALLTDSSDRIERRFNQIALAPDIAALTYYLRTFIPILREASINLDYAMLANDILWYQTESGQKKVRLSWGQDYYKNSLYSEEEDI